MGCNVLELNHIVNTYNFFERTLIYSHRKTQVVTQLKGLINMVSAWVHVLQYIQYKL